MRVAAQSCKTKQLPTGVEISCPGEKPVIVKHGEQGQQGVDGVDGVAGSDGARGKKGTDMTIDRTISCVDNVPNYSGVKFTLVASVFSTGDVYYTMTMYDDETTFGSGTSWNSPVKIFRDKQLNDDWATFSFSIDLSNLDYNVFYQDPVDGDETVTVSNICEEL